MSIWTKESLESLALPGMASVEGNLQKEIIRIIQEREPEMVFDVVEQALYGRRFTQAEAIPVAWAASWLAVAKRENQKWFHEIVAKL